MRPLSFALPALVLMALLGACQDRDPPPPMEPVEGRKETRGIRNTEAIGYAGDAIADEVDAALDAMDERTSQLDAAIEAQTP
ncbi:hypothetical protein [Sinimarinibacterium thermocellulolyticum]|uniref:Lipoprotein n=1 Tax=Sinimarinibacterium thermocellulolyticum TaxID=3170016 RepID=A0ABV2A778_9GAMM